MKIRPDCISCLVKQSIDTIRLITIDENIIFDILQLIFNELSSLDPDMTPPGVARRLQSIIRRELNINDPYYHIKQRSTLKAFEMFSEASDAIQRSEFPFATAIAFSIAGNILDFAKGTSWNEELITETFSMVPQKVLLFDEVLIKRLYYEIANASVLLYLGDNAGEAVFDSLLLQYFPEGPKIYYGVKSGPILNDITAKEAQESGLPEKAQIIANGADIPGTELDKCSSEFLSLFNKADVIISKGQGNFETLADEKRKIWFLFQVKCSVIAQACGHQTGTWMIYEKPKYD